MPDEGTNEACGKSLRQRRLVWVLGGGSILTFVVILYVVLGRWIGLNTSELTVTRIVPNQAEATEGLVFALPRGVLTIKAEFTVRRCEVVENPSDGDPLFVFEMPAEITLEHRVEADPEAQYLINAESMVGVMADTLSSYRLSPGGWLRTVSVSRTDQTAHLAAIATVAAAAIPGRASGFDVDRSGSDVSYRDMSETQKEEERVRLAAEYCRPLVLESTEELRALRALSHQNSLEDEHGRLIDEQIEQAQENLRYTDVAVLLPYRTRVKSIGSQLESSGWSAKSLQDAGLAVELKLPINIWNRWVTDSGLEQLQRDAVNRDPFLDLRIVTVVIAPPHSLDLGAPGNGIAYRIAGERRVAVCRPECPEDSNTWGIHPQVRMLKTFEFPQLGIEASVPIQTSVLSSHEIGLEFSPNGQLLELTTSDELQLERIRDLLNSAKLNE